MANRCLLTFQLRQERHGQREVDAAPSGARRTEHGVLLDKYFAPSGACYRFQLFGPRARPH